MRIRISRIVVAVALSVISFDAGAQPGSEQGWGEQPKRLVREAHALVAEHFYDKAKLDALNWDALAEGPPLRDVVHNDADSIYLSVYTNVGYPATIDINRMLERLGASHCAHYNWSLRGYYDLMDIFSASPAIHDHAVEQFPPDGRVEVVSAGFTWDWFNRYRHVTEVFPGSAAERARVRTGDGMIVNEGNHGEIPLHRQMVRAIERGTTVEFDVNHTGPWRNRWREVRIEPIMVNPTEEYLENMSKSASVNEHDSVKLGYVRIFSWAGQHYQDRLEELLQREPLASADGVILDIRGGWGGANPQYLDLFGAPMPTLTHIPREGEAFTWDPSEDLPERTFYWRKPVVLLVDGGTRSGKEIIAYAFKKHHIGPVVGSRTAGAVLAGRPFILSDGSLLYLAVADVLVDGERLEGVGVEPDVVVERDLPFSNGADPQLEAARDALLAEIRKERE